MVPTEVEEPELDYPSSVPLMTGPSSGHSPPLLVYMDLRLSKTSNGVPSNRIEGPLYRDHPEPWR